MLNKIFFRNYKRFRDEQELELRPVTLLVGRNSSGKSSVTKLLPLIANATKGKIDTPFLFENDGISVGSSFADVGNNGSRLGLMFGMEYSNGSKIKVDMASDSTGQRIKISRYEMDYLQDSFVLEMNEDRDGYNSNERADERYEISSFSGLLNMKLLEKTNLSLSDFSINVDYIGPFRCVPERIVNSKGHIADQSVGYDGMKAYQLLCQYPRLVEAVSEWYKKSFDGCRLKVELVTGLLGAYQLNLYKKDSDYPINISDEGQGMSQVLPIITRANMLVKDSIVVMEQPELHLHPRAHASIAQLLAWSSKQRDKDGALWNQHYLVETHSENIILGLRDAVVDKNVDFGPNDVIIYFVEERKDGTSWLKPIYITEKGELTYWPKGVFNESYELLRNLQIKANS